MYRCSICSCSDDDGRMRPCAVADAHELAVVQQQAKEERHRGSLHGWRSKTMSKRWSSATYSFADSTKAGVKNVEFLRSVHPVCRTGMFLCMKAAGGCACQSRACCRGGLRGCTHAAATGRLAASHYQSPGGEQQAGLRTRLALPTSLSLSCYRPVVAARQEYGEATAAASKRARTCCAARKSGFFCPPDEPKTSACGQGGSKTRHTHAHAQGRAGVRSARLFAPAPARTRKQETNSRARPSLIGHRPQGRKGQRRQCGDGR